MKASSGFDECIDRANTSCGAIIHQDVKKHSNKYGGGHGDDGCSRGMTMMTLTIFSIVIAAGILASDKGR